MKLTRPIRAQLLQIAASMLLVISIGHAKAATPAVFATGLQFPSKIIAIHGGNLLVTETGSLPNTGRVSLIDSSGIRRTLIDQLPSGISEQGTADGPNGIALVGRILFVSNGEGDTHVLGPEKGTLELNPKGPSSPIFSTILCFRFNDDVAYLNAGFALTAAQQGELADGLEISLDNGLGQTATAALITAFRVDRPDPVTIYRNTHLYGLANLEDDPVDTLFVADAGNNAVWRVSREAETPRLVIRFPNTPDPLFPQGPPTSEAVPTSVHLFGDKLLVSLLTGVPFAPGTSRVMLVNPSTGEAIPFITGLTSTIDVLPRYPSRLDSEIFILEYSTQLLTGAPGRLLIAANGQVQVLASDLTTPSSMALDESRGSLFITDRTDGTILKLALR